MTYSDEGESRKIALLTLSVAEQFNSGSWTATVVNSESGTRSDAITPTVNGNTYAFKIRSYGDTLEIASTNGLRMNFNLYDLAKHSYGSDGESIPADESDAEDRAKLIAMFDPNTATHTVTVKYIDRTYENVESELPSATAYRNGETYTFTRDLNGIYTYTVETEATYNDGTDDLYYFSYWFVYDGASEEILSYDLSVHNKIDADIIIYAVYVRPEEKKAVAEPISGIKSVKQTQSGTKKRLELATYYNVPTGTTVVNKGFILIKDVTGYSEELLADQLTRSYVQDTKTEEWSWQVVKADSGNTNISVRSYSINNPALTYGTLTYSAKSSAGFDYSVVSFIVIDNGDSTYSYVFSAPQVIPTVD